MAVVLVMIVENDHKAAAEIESLVRQLGYQITAIVTSVEIVPSVTASQRPDVVLINIELVQIDGVRKVHDTLGVPIIYLVAPESLARLEEPRLPRPFGYLVRPYRSDVLRSNIEISLHYHRAEQALRTSNNQLKHVRDSLAEAQALAHVGSWDEDLASGVLHISKECMRIHRLDPKGGKLSLNQMLRYVPPDERVRLDELYQRARETGDPFDTEYRVITNSTENRFIYHKLAVRRGTDGRPSRLIAMVQDITERKQAEESLRRSEERASRLLAERDFILENSKDVLYYADRNGFIYYISPVVEKLTGYTIEEWSGHLSTHLVDSENTRRIMGETEEILRTGREYPPSIVEIRHKDGHVIFAEINERPIINDGEVAGVVGVARDVTERLQAENRLRQAAAVFENTLEAVIIADAEARITAVNNAFTEITGYSEADVVGRPPDFLSASEEEELFRKKVWKIVDETGRWSGEIWNRRRSGEIFPAWLAISTIHDDEGRLTNYVSVLSDLSHLKESEKKLDVLAHYDPLTRLPNRLLFNARLAHALRRAEREKGEVAVLFVDLDRFKNVNDTLGHPAGDRLLAEVGRRLVACLRKEDTVARLSGDEFLIIIEDVRSPRNVLDIARKATDSLSAPYQLDGHEALVTASIGISMYPRDGKSVDQLIQNADAAMYRAKERGRGNVGFYTEELTIRARERLSMETALRVAIRNGEFILRYQPQVSLQSGEVVGVEALLRWQHPERGMILPTSFMSLVEEMGLIASIGNWVLKEACAQMRVWREAGARQVRLAINLSAYQLTRDTNLVEHVTRVLNEAGLDPHWLELEITESALMRNAEEAVGLVDELKSCGIGIAIDDFGTGYSSMSYLKRFSVDKLKVDCSFTQNLPRDPSDRAITEAIIALAHSLNMRVIAEGVETLEQKQFLLHHGCDEIQGFFFSKPLTGQEFLRLLTH